LHALRLFTPVIAVLAQIGNDGAQLGHQGVRCVAVLTLILPLGGRFSPMSGHCFGEITYAPEWH